MRKSSGVALKLSLNELFDSLDQYWFGLFGDWVPLGVMSSDNLAMAVRKEVTNYTLKNSQSTFSILHPV